MFWTTNPMYDHGICEWIKDFYLDEYGIPLKEKSGVKRWFVLQNNKPVWFNDEDSAIEYCNGLPDVEGHKPKPRTFTSIRAHITDNIPLMRNNPDYLSNLQALPEIKRRIFLDGSWFAREEEAGLYNRAMSKIVPYPNMSAKLRVRAWDLSCTAVSSANSDPDWTRGVLISKDSVGTYTVEDIVSIRDRPHIVETLIYRTAREDMQFYGKVVYVLPVDPGAAGKARAMDIKRQLAEFGVETFLVRPTKAKRVRFLPFSAVAEAGFTSVVKATWNDEFFNELEQFTGLKRHERDDIVDCCSDAMLALNQVRSLPNFTLPNLESSPQQFGVQSTDFSTGLSVGL